jgi:hypothetical protein
MVPPLMLRMLLMPINQSIYGHQDLKIAWGRRRESEGRISKGFECS